MKTDQEISELMQARFMSLTLAPCDNRGTVRTGMDWFNRYMIYPWERPSEFEQVTNTSDSGMLQR